MAVARPRPPWEHLVEAGGFSFPSGHSLNSAATYGLLAVVAWRSAGSGRPVAVARRRRRGGAAVRHRAVARSRSGVHYPSDVLGGWTRAIVVRGGGAVLDHRGCGRWRRTHDPRHRRGSARRDPRTGARAGRRGALTRRRTRPAAPHRRHWCHAQAHGSPPADDRPPRPAGLAVGPQAVRSVRARAVGARSMPSSCRSGGSRGGSSRISDPPTAARPTRGSRRWSPRARARTRRPLRMLANEAYLRLAARLGPERTSASSPARSGSTSVRRSSRAPWRCCPPGAARGRGAGRGPLGRGPGARLGVDAGPVALGRGRAVPGGRPGRGAAACRGLRRTRSRSSGRSG